MSRGRQCGQSHVVEPELEDLLHFRFEERELHATADADDSGVSFDVLMFCVGTPGSFSGGFNLDFIERSHTHETVQSQGQWWLPPRALIGGDDERATRALDQLHPGTSPPGSADLESVELITYLANPTMPCQCSQMAFPARSSQ